MNRIPTLEEFLAAPIESVREVAPNTIILTNGGTRRRAVLEGILPTSDEYAEFTRGQMITCLEMLFRHGVEHIFTTILAESNHAEVTDTYRTKLVEWVTWGLAGPEAIEDYKRFGWRVRLVGTESWKELEPVAQALRHETPGAEGPAVWLTVASNAESRWDHLLETAVAKTICTRSDLIREVYGEDIPLAEVFIGSGKPQVFASIVPPLLVGKLQCYWRQHLGFDLDERTFRSILYDYAFLRKTWQSDKTGRAEKIMDYAAYWEDPPVVGLGARLGPFWYPSLHPSSKTYDAEVA